jgi:hypothetical protein
LIAEIRVSIPVSPGKPARYDYEYSRCGVCNTFLACGPLAGKRMVKASEKRTKHDWARFVQEIAVQYEEAEKITLVMDNLSTHTPGALYETFPPQRAKGLWDRFDLVFTLKHGSWLNMAETELNVLTKQCLNRRISDIEVVRAEVSAWQAHRSNLESKVNWQFTTENARIKLARLYPTVDD